MLNPGAAVTLSRCKTFDRRERIDEVRQGRGYYFRCGFLGLLDWETSLHTWYTDSFSWHLSTKAWSRNQGDEMFW